MQETIPSDNEEKLSKMLYEILASKTSEQSPSKPCRVLVALAGCPGSGKSTLARVLTRRVNALAKREVCATVGMDGYHLTRAALDAMPNAKEAHTRRGIEWTFDVTEFGKVLHKLAYDQGAVSVATFDHAVKDPVEGGCRVGENIEMVIVEGLYVLLNYGEWARTVLPFFRPGCRWFLDCPPETAKARVVKRHVEAGISSTEEEAAKRWDSNDGPNAQFLREHLLKVDVCIPSVTMPSSAL